MRVWTLLHIGEHDEQPVTIFTDEDALWEQVRGDAEQAQRDHGVPMPEDPEMWPEYILGNGWKVSAYEVFEHEIEVCL